MNHISSSRPVSFAFLLGAATIFCTTLRAGDSPSASRPNFLIIVADDLGANDLGISGSEFYETPHLDALSRRGLRFSQAYAAGPVCSPTRSSLLTGQAPARSGHTDYFGAPLPHNVERHWSWKGQHRPLLPAPHIPRLKKGTVTVASLLREAGYRTFFAGKWHLGPEGSWPEDHGFMINRGGTHRGGPYGPGGYFTPYDNPRLEDGPPGEHIDHRLAEETIRFIQETRGEPFLAWLSFFSVHTPLMAPPALVEKYERKRADLELADRWEAWGPEPDQRTRVNQSLPVYAAMIETMDQAVGKVVGYLSDSGLIESTIIVFVSDNGGLSTAEGYPTSNAPLRAGKGWLFEGGVRIPWICSGPGLRHAETLDAPIITTDLLPTILDLARVPPPSNWPLDGISLADWWKGGPEPVGRSLFWHYPHYSNQGQMPASAVRRGDWKLILMYESEKALLYHLPSDPQERLDVSQTKEALTTEIKAELHLWLKAVGARMPVANPQYYQQ